MGKKIDNANKALGILGSIVAIGGTVVKVISATQGKKS